MDPTSAHSPFTRLAIIGVGLIGGSLGLSVRARGLAHEVVGIDPSADTLKRARRIQAIDWAARSLGEGIRGADCVVVAAPISAISDLLRQIVPYVGEATLVTDVGSVKSSIVAAGEALFGGRFVGGHPMAGSERSGVEAAMPALFVDAAWAIVRSESRAADDNWAEQRLAALAAAVGARPMLLNPAQHDRIAALVSHLPHLLSFAYARTIAGDAEPELARRMAGGSCRDLLRVSTADPDLWRDIFRDNREFLREAVAGYEGALAELKRRYGLDQP